PCRPRLVAIRAQARDLGLTFGLAALGTSLGLPGISPWPPFGPSGRGYGPGGLRSGWGSRGTAGARPRLRRRTQRESQRGAATSRGRAGPSPEPPSAAARTPAGRG